METELLVPKHPQACGSSQSFPLLIPQYASPIDRNAVDLVHHVDHFDSEGLSGFISSTLFDLLGCWVRHSKPGRKYSKNLQLGLVYKLNETVNNN